MKTSYSGIKLITSFEGCRLKAYKPVPTEKYWTIGYGHYGADVSPNMVISQNRAEELLRAYLKKFEAKVDKYDSIYHFTQNEYDALVSFAYNIGSIDQLVANGKRTKAEIAAKIPAYNKAGGRVLAGLTKRRASEQQMFMSYPTIRKGDKNEYVLKMQKLLNKAKVLGGGVPETGVFCLVSYNALIEYQGTNGLVKDGICGAKSWASLRRYE